MADVNFIVDGKKLTAPAGTLLIDACRKAGIEIPAFCYYPGLSLQAACRMCVVRQEKVGKLQTACTTAVAEGQVFTTESAEIAQARKATIELLLGNHPLDCPVCDAGGECELQDMTFKYGAGESLYAEVSNGRRPSTMTARAASSATAASASAARGWTCGRWASRTAASTRSSRPIA
jgi:NADH-quinone oxidoreductase subunit G